MKNLKKIIVAFSVAAIVALGVFIKIIPPTSYAETANQAPALFETSLAAAMNSSDTSLTLLSGTTRDGTTLSGTYCFTIDSGLSTTEYVCGTASSTSVTGLTRGIGSDGVTSFTALKFAHRYGADVKVTDFPQIQQHYRFLSGVGAIPSPLKYITSLPSFLTDDAQLASVGYVKSVTTQGAPPASTSTAGLIVFATPAQLASSTATTTYNANTYYLAAPSSAFGSTSTSTNMVPVTGTNGKLSQGFLDLTQGFTFSGGLTSTATTTLSGNNTLSGTTTISGPLTVSGTVSGSFPGTKIGALGAVTLTANATTTIFSATVPANTLSTSSVVHAEVDYTSTPNNSSTTIKFIAAYGGTTMINSTRVTNSGSAAWKGRMFIDLMGNASTSSQKAVMTSIFNDQTDSTSTTAWYTYKTGTSSIDSTAAQTFSLTFFNNDSGGTYSVDNWWVEKITN